MKYKALLSLALVALAACAAWRPAAAATAVYTDEATFTAQLASSYLEDFSAYTYGSYQGSTLDLGPTNSFSYRISASSSTLYSGLSNMSTNTNTADLVVTMTGSGVNAVGGHFFCGDLTGNYSAASATVTLSDGTVETFTPPNDTTFRGFVSTVPITSVRITSGSLAGRQWATMDHFYVGVAETTPPTSSVSALTSPTNSTSIPVSWTSDDGGGTGVAAVHLYVSYSGGTYSEAGSGFTGTGTTYTAGSGDGTYSFYTRAEDYAGNLEDAPGAADASVVVETAKPTSSVSAITTLQNTHSFSVSWVADDGAGTGVAAVHLYYRYNGGADTEFGTYPAGTNSTTFTSPEGSGTYDLYTTAEDNVGNVEDAPAAPDQTVLVSVPTSLAFTVPPIGGRAMVALAPAIQVSVLDDKGNVVPNATHSITVALASNPTSSPLYGTKTQAAVNGVATFSDLRLSRVGKGYTLAASAAGVTGATSAPFPIISGAAEQLVFVTQPSDTQSGFAISPAVQVKAVDGLGNVVTSYAGPVAVSLYSNTGRAALGGTLSVAPVAGIATFPGLSISTVAKGYTLRATAPRVSGAVSNPFNVTP